MSTLGATTEAMAPAPTGSQCASGGSFRKPARAIQANRTAHMTESLVLMERKSGESARALVLERGELGGPRPPDREACDRANRKCRHQNGRCAGAHGRDAEGVCEDDRGKPGQQRHVERRWKLAAMQNKAPRRGRRAAPSGRRRAASRAIGRRHRMSAEAVRPSPAGTFASSPLVLEECTM